MPVLDVKFADLRPWQAEAWDKLKRFSVLVIHRRAGKTVFSIAKLLAKVLEQPHAIGAYIAPQLKQARRAAWSYLHQMAGSIPEATFNETELRVDLPTGGRIYLLGTDNADAIRGVGLDFAVLDEVSQMGQAAWSEVIRPALSDRQGGAIFIGTPLGMSNLFYELYSKAADLPDWFRMLLTVYDTGALPAEEILALKREMSEEEFAQEELCDWSAAVRGSFYGREMAEAERSGRIARVPHDPALKVHTSLDLGIRHAFVVWMWQVVGAEVRAIGARAYKNSSIPDIWADLCQLRYNWGRHYAPHDSKVRELGSGKSRQEIARAIGWDWEIVPEVGVRAGVESARLLLPRVWFDREACKDGIEALKIYRREYDDTRRILSLQPYDSWECDFADALRMFAVGSQGKSQDFSPIDYSRENRAVI